MNRYSEESDKVLVELTLLGESDAYEELVKRHEKSVLGTAIKVTKSKYTAEDASQDAFVSAWMHLDSLRNAERFGPWVCSIAKNSARTLAAHYRMTAPEISLDLASFADPDGESDSELDRILFPSQSGEQIRYERLSEAVGRLSEGVRRVITLHYFEDLSVAEIAGKLSIPEGTVKWRLSEGRKKLRKEYGIMEKTYDENESLVRRVMYQVEKLKLWELRPDKTGFEEEYCAVLALAETLDDGEEKSHAMADILLRGYWWLEGEKNDEVLERVKAEALAGGNDDVMQAVMLETAAKYYRKTWFDAPKTIETVETELVPYLEEHPGFPRAMGALKCFIAGRYGWMKGAGSKARAKYEEAMTILTPKDGRYHAAKCVIDLCDRHKDVLSDDREEFFLGGLCVTFRRIEDALCFWHAAPASIDPGNKVGDLAAHLFWFHNKTVLDPAWKPGDVIVTKKSEDDVYRIEVIPEEKSVTTPAGTFEGCTTVLDIHLTNYGTFEYRRTFCPGVGVVRAEWKENYYDGLVWELSSYDVKGEGLLPLEVGNRWTYAVGGPLYDGENVEREIEVSVDYGEKDMAQVVTKAFIRRIGYEDSWLGKMREARDRYYDPGEDGSGERVLDVSACYERAAKLAETPRQKVHAEMAAKAAKRMYDTDFVRKDDTIEERPLNGLWNFFQYDKLKRRGKEIRSFDEHRNFGFEWKCPGIGGRNGYYILNNFFPEIIGDVMHTDVVWSDDWVPGFHTENEVDDFGEGKVKYTLDVSAAGEIVTPAGKFSDCIRIDLWSDMRFGREYMGGKKEYYFAPGIGIVKYVAYFEDEPLEYNLTEYRGTGEGYYPIADGLFRRCEAITIGDGCEASVETYVSVEGEDVVLMTDQLGTQSRAWCAAAAKEKEANEAIDSAE